MAAVKTHDYQWLVNDRAVNRATFEDIEYLNCGVIGETGELAEEVKKMLRDDNGHLTDARRAATAEKQVVEAQQSLHFLRLGFGSA